MTKRNKIFYKIFSFLSFICTVIPLGYFLMVGFLNGSVGTKNKVVLGMTVIVCAILLLINTVRKYNLKSPIYILIIGIYACVDNLMLLFVIMTISTFLDEFLFTPCKKHFKAKYIINKEIDHRGY